jgi:hypothetical protein
MVGHGHDEYVVASVVELVRGIESEIVSRRLHLGSDFLKDTSGYDGLLFHCMYLIIWILSLVRVGEWMMFYSSDVLWLDARKVKPQCS